MIKVEIQYKGNGLDHIRVRGHANTAEYGHDLVCAAVSAVTIGALNALEQEDSYDISIEDGDVEVIAKGHIDEHDMTVIETFIIQLKTIEESNHGALEIKERKD